MLWAEQDLCLGAQGPREARAMSRCVLRKRQPAKNELVEAADGALFGAGDKLARDIAYSQATARMHEQHPQDDEVAVMYQMSLPAPRDRARPPRGTRCRRRRLRSTSSMLSTASGRRAFHHPSLSTDPDHAIRPRPRRAVLILEHLSLAPPRAAYAVAHLRPARDAGRRHQIEHRRLQGAAVDFADKQNLPRGREDFHTLSRLH